MNGTAKARRSIADQRLAEAVRRMALRVSAKAVRIKAKQGMLCRGNAIQ